jgi:hypothetical protein
VQSGAVGGVQPVAGIEGQQFNLGSLGQCGGLVKNQSASVNPSLDRHTKQANTRLAA